MKDLRTAFLVKYPKYEIILNMYSKANDCPATWENLSKVRLQAFVDYMEERLAPNSVRQYAAKLKAVLNLYNEEVELPKDYNKILSVKNVRSTNVYIRNIKVFIISVFGGIFFKNNNITLYDFINYLLKLIIGIG